LNAQGGNPVWLLDIEDEFIDSVANTLNAAPHIRAWKRETLPEYLHYGTNPRVLDVIVVADNGWSALWSERVSEEHYVGGTHGYDPTSKDMHAIFYAMGPAFKPGYVNPTFENIHVYSLLAHILKIQPAETDGDLSAVKGMLRNP
jgi:alkaline phosphatase D